jgi:hypothetical protein
VTTSRPIDAVSRRTALAGISATGLGLALTATTHHASAQEATPFPMAGHPFVGAWIVDRNPDDPTEIPTYNVITADGAVIDPTQGGAGVWEATGPDTANFTLSGTIAELSAYFIARGSVTVDSGGGTATNSFSSTIVAADGTVLDELSFAQDTARYTRISIEPESAVGQPLAGFPTWTPATPTPGTPTS